MNTTHRIIGAVALSLGALAATAPAHADDGSNGPAYLRIDASDVAGYWDAIVDSPPE
ncbi:hypothetical protein OG978_47305 (plasmid) [Streptomyces sp. NBC_01591]|uniref:hypothetical protein n=1 Tax=Streptomyces sp. NBC_01591 TaxID=2975888 RepID=UPI002DD7E366|nr:hypothetical protein [Streptomyces sp. NBC_01591]WSD66021.1 hypothetical protein OG978_00115 [Streptomyces sp. NBC_01591]WSD73098.1 hypothetical protein OG978_40710 [Streptomyces sp. NBC_01591]WSD73629.1 hypothetical protein OG978_40935 [Streptomyces sp. NBC_01591]WSD74584.1 hypothetical protein OG978_47305 [Streptomyces sp. NBC_01591]